MVPDSRRSLTAPLGSACEEREQYLTQAKLNSSANDKETLVPGVLEELDIEKTL
jgi:hypothetical protein